MWKVSRSTSYQGQNVNVPEVGHERPPASTSGDSPLNHLVTDVRTSKRHMASSTCLVTRCRLLKVWRHSVTSTPNTYLLFLSINRPDQWRHHPMHSGSPMTPASTSGDWAPDDRLIKCPDLWPLTLTLAWLTCHHDNHHSPTVTKGAF